MTRLFPLSSLLPVLLLCLSLTASAAWEIAKINGQDYVSTDSMKSYYGFTSQKRSGNRLTLENKFYRVKMRIGSPDCDMNGIRFVFSYPVLDHNSKAWVSRIDLTKLIHPVLRPEFIKDAANFTTVIIDPGHGGKDIGCTSPLGNEADYNLKIAKLLQKKLQALKYRVVMTRDSDRFISLQGRVDLANRVTENALFISIHQNSASNSSASGIETFTLSPVGVAHYGRGLKSSDFTAKTGNLHDSANVALATAVHSTVLTVLAKPETKRQPPVDRGIKRARFNVLSGVRHPSILLECGFLTNPYEARLMNLPAYQNTIAQCIAQAIHRYRIAVSQQNPAAKR